MRNTTIAIASVIGALSVQVSLASPSVSIHFIYTKAGGTYEQFQNDRDVCVKSAKSGMGYNVGQHYFVWRDRPSSTVFLNCMAAKGYTISRTGWDTGVL